MIIANLDKCKEIAHTVRRQDRDTKMQPLDIQATIPDIGEEAEIQRAIIRDQNSQIQVKIEESASDVEIKFIIDNLDDVQKILAPKAMNKAA